MAELVAHPYGGTPVAVQVSVMPTCLWGARMDSDTYGGGGDAPWDAGTWATFESHAGKAVSLCSFGQPAPWVQSFASSPFESCRARGAIAVCDMNTGTTALSSIASGSYDQPIIAWANAVRTYGRPFMLRWNWEMNGTWFSWGAQAASSPSTYVAAWRRFRSLCDSAGATNITWVWCPNVVFSGSTSLASLYPGDAYVEWVGMDGYNFGTNPIKPGGWRSFSTTFGETYAELATLAPSKPMMVNEVGCTEFGGSKPAWISGMFSALESPAFSRIRAFSWFNWNILDGSGRWDWPIESSAATQSSFASAVASPRYRSGGAGSLPLLSKIGAP